MATTKDYIEFVCDQIDPAWNKRYKKMFGEYMVYINEKPLLLVCDNTVYVKELDCIRMFFPEENKGFPYKGFPYKGAKQHFILDVDDKELLNNVIEALEKVIQVPVKKTKKNS